MRKQIEIIINDPAGDSTFRITQMPATQGERWMIKLIKLLVDAGYEGLADAFKNHLGLKNNDQAALVDSLLMFVHGLPIEKTLELWDELYSCCVRTSGGIEQQVTAATVDGFLVDPLSLVQLKLAAAKVQLQDFFTEAGQRKFKAIAAMLAPASKKTQ